MGVLFSKQGLLETPDCCGRRDGEVETMEMAERR
jgi:hypothetical protein